MADGTFVTQFLGKQRRYWDTASSYSSQVRLVLEFTPITETVGTWSYKLNLFDEWLHSCVNDDKECCWNDNDLLPHHDHDQLHDGGEQEHQHGHSSGV